MDAISVKNVSKRFRVYHDKNITLKERLLFFNRNCFDVHQVLDCISLEIKKGTTVGLIGRNGSGKSTLLKLLTGIIYPDSGDIEINGRVSSLLELGAGFHPDFTGKENIYNNASIFGLSRQEINKRYKLIVEFSELGEFINSPVRTYSSGMYMRLAFSVAINVDADILLVDEILAVGDANFQKKCMDKIKELKRNGITIVLVTHDMGAVEKICDKAIWLDQGQIKNQGPSIDIVKEYLEHMGERQLFEHKNSKTAKTAQLIDKAEENGDSEEISIKKRWGSRDVVVKDVQMMNDEGINKAFFKCGEKITILLKYEKHKDIIDKPVIGIGIFRNDGINCYGTNTMIDRISNIELKNKGEVRCIIESLTLLEGRYSLDVAIENEDGFPYDYIRNILEFDVISDKKEVGVTRLKHRWIVDDKEFGDNVIMKDRRGGI